MIEFFYDIFYDIIIYYDFMIFLFMIVFNVFSQILFLFFCHISFFVGLKLDCANNDGFIIQHVFKKCYNSTVSLSVNYYCFIIVIAIYYSYLNKDIINKKTKYYIFFIFIYIA